jgi:hypothetical protein
MDEVSKFKPIGADLLMANGGAGQHKAPANFSQPPPTKAKSTHEYVLFFSIFKSFVNRFNTIKILILKESKSHRVFRLETKTKKPKMK